MTTTPKSRRGFAAMSPEKARELQSRGGKGVPAEKRAFSVDPALAREAASLGGKASRGTKDERYD